MTSAMLPKAAFWRSFDMFAGLGPAATDALAHAMQRRVWGAGEVMFQRGDQGDWMALIETGRVKLTLLTAQGRELVLRHASSGDSLGEMSLLDGEVRSADATAMSDVTAWVLDRARFAEVSGVHPAIILATARYFCLRLRETTEQLEGIALYPLEARLARFFLVTLRQLNGDALPQTAVITLDFSQSELAAFLGASRPKVNRALQVLQEMGALTRVDEHWRVDVPKMQTLAAD